MLRRRNRAVEGWVIALDAPDELRRENSGEERIFAVGLLPASPTRISEDVDVRRPESQAEVAPRIPLALRLVVLGTRFGRDHLAFRMDQRFVPRRRHANRMRENGCLAGAR